MSPLGGVLAPPESLEFYLGGIHVMKDFQKLVLHAWVLGWFERVIHTPGLVKGVHIVSIHVMKQVRLQATPSAGV